MVNLPPIRHSFFISHNNWQLPSAGKRNRPKTQAQSNGRPLPFEACTPTDYIFVEGIAQVRFLQCYVKHPYDKSLSEDDIVKTDGWNKLSNPEYITLPRMNHL